MEQSVHPRRSPFAVRANPDATEEGAAVLGRGRFDIYPVTGRGTRTGIEVPDIGSFDFRGLMPTTCLCQVCGHTHLWRHADAWLERQQASRVHIRPAIAAVKS